VVLGSALALAGGLVLALGRRSRVRAVSAAASSFVSFVRNTPLLIQLYFLFYVLPRAGVRLTPMVAGVVALGLHYSTYTSEVYRAGIESVPCGQWDAVTALNLEPRRAFFRVILPQAVRPIIPALGNYVVAMFKETPLLSTITVVETLYVAKDIGSETFRYLEPFTLAGVLFLAVSLLAAGVIRLVERRVPAYGA
jgi:polar amino acid transport system permease protein